MYPYALHFTGINSSGMQGESDETRGEMMQVCRYGEDTYLFRYLQLHSESFPQGTQRGIRIFLNLIRT